MAPHEILKKGKLTGGIAKRKATFPVKPSAGSSLQKKAIAIQKSKKSIGGQKHVYDSNMGVSSEDESSRSSVESLPDESDTSDDYLHKGRKQNRSTSEPSRDMSLQKSFGGERSFQIDRNNTPRGLSSSRKETVVLHRANADHMDSDMELRKFIELQQNKSATLYANQTREIKKVEKNILDAVKVVTNTVNKFRQEFTEYRKQYHAHITDIQNVVIDGGAKGKSFLGHSNKKGFANTVLKEFPLLGSQVRCSFSDDMLSEACLKTMCDFFSKAISPSVNGSRDKPSLIGKCISVIMFAQQKDMTKKVYQTGIGRQHANYRYVIVCRSIDLMRCNFTIRNPSYRNDKSNERSNHMFSSKESIDGSTVKESILPDWVRSDSVINAEVLKYTRMTFDLPKNQVSKSKDTMSFMKGVFISTSVYDIVLDRLRGMRDDSRCSFFETCAFLFYKWNIPGCPNVQCTPKVSFRQLYFDYNPASIRKTRTDDTDSGRQENRMLLLQTYKMHAEFVINCSYPTKVIEKNRRTKSSLANSDVPCQLNQNISESIKTINRSIHLIEVALIWCLALCRKEFNDESKMEFLNSHEESLQILYRIAYVFHSLMVEKYEEDGKEAESKTVRKRNVRDNPEENIQSNDENGNEIGKSFEKETKGYMTHPKFSVSLKDLICGKESQKRIINNKVLSIRKQQYEDLHIPIGAVDEEDDEEIEDGDQNMLNDMSFDVDELHMLDIEG